MAEQRRFPALDWQIVADRRAGSEIGGSIVYLPEIDSTNSYAAALPLGAAVGTVVVADYQTAGRGRLNRPWVAAFGGSLTFTVLLGRSEPAWLIPMAAGLALVTTLAAIGIGADLKWPNDVLIAGRKCCGILIENSIVAGRPRSVLGIGLNVYEVDPALPNATCLATHASSLPAREHILIALLEQIERWLDRGAVAPADVRQAWRARLITLGQRIEARTPREIVRGLAQDVEDDGALIVGLDDGSRRTVRAGDVTLAAAPGSHSRSASEKHLFRG